MHIKSLKEYTQVWELFILLSIVLPISVPTRDIMKSYIVIPFEDLIVSNSFGNKIVTMSYEIWELFLVKGDSKLFRWISKILFILFISSLVEMISN